MCTLQGFKAVPMRERPQQNLLYVCSIQCPPLILAPLVNMSKGSCENKSALFILFNLSFKKFTNFQPIIEVKQLKVGRGISLWNKCFHYFMLATIIGTQLLQRPFPSTTALSFLINAWRLWRTPDKRSETISSYRISPDPSDSQLHDGAASLQFTSLIFCRVQVRGQRQQW